MIKISKLFSELKWYKIICFHSCKRVNKAIVSPTSDHYSMLNEHGGPHHGEGTSTSKLVHNLYQWRKAL